MNEENEIQDTQAGDTSSVQDTAQNEIPDANSENTKWYVLRVVNGKEKKVKEYLDKEVKINGWSEAIPQILCPVEKVYKIQGGKKTIRDRILYPGYLMLEGVNGKFNDTMIHDITVTNGVVHFLGKEHPIPLRKAEVNKMFGNLDDVSEQGIAIAENYIIGSSVKITDGPFNEFQGTIEEVNIEKRKLKVIVKIFGRDTAVELNFSQVENIA